MVDLSPNLSFHWVARGANVAVQILAKRFIVNRFVGYFVYGNCPPCFYGENSQILRFDKICDKLALFQKYLEMYHFFSTRVPQNRVQNSIRVRWTRVPSESLAWHYWPGICVIKKNNVVLDITEIEYLFIVLNFSAIEYLVFLFFLFFLSFSTFCFWWNGLNSQT